MDLLIKYSQLRLNNTQTKFIRYLYHKINWEDRLIGITGARGTGKTTLMLQYMKNKFKNTDVALYISLDNLYFAKNSLFEVAESHYLNGGRTIFIDEVHKYENWSVEIKNLYDIYHNLQIIFSGSSALQLHKSEGDLSRRAAIYNLHELSFREYLILNKIIKSGSISLEEILNNHRSISHEITKDFSIIPLFKSYLKEGSYPFFKESKGKFHDRLTNTINVIIENDLPQIENINFQTAYKLRKIIALLADSVPFKINIAELSRKSTISRDMLIRLIQLLDRANLLKGINQAGAATGHLTKPEKLYLNNTTLLYALSSKIDSMIGTVRETFFMNQLYLLHRVNTAKEGDFLIDHKYVFEIGGKNKSKKQVANIKNSYIALDNIEAGYGNTIPLWLFGFTY